MASLPGNAFDWARLLRVHVAWGSTVLGMKASLVIPLNPFDEIQLGYSGFECAVLAFISLPTSFARLLLVAVGHCDRTCAQAAWWRCALF